MVTSGLGNNEEPKKRLRSGSVAMLILWTAIGAGALLLLFCASEAQGAASSTIAAIKPIPDILVIGKTPFMIQRRGAGSGSRR